MKIIQETKQKNLTKVPQSSGIRAVLKDEKGRFIKGTAKPPNSGAKLGTKTFTTKVKEALEKIAEGKDYTYEEAFIKSILKKAIVDGDASTQKLIWNYLDGLPVQKIMGMGDDSKVVNIQINKKVINIINNAEKQLEEELRKGIEEDGNNNSN